MTRNDIIRLARKAGIASNSEYLVPDENVIDGLERFAAFVAAAEREACAKIVEMPWQGHYREVAEQIRARGQE